MSIRRMICLLLVVILFMSCVSSLSEAVEDDLPVSADPVETTPEVMGSFELCDFASGTPSASDGADAASGSEIQDPEDEPADVAGSSDADDTVSDSAYADDPEDGLPGSDDPQSGSDPVSVADVADADDPVDGLTGSDDPQPGSDPENVADVAVADTSNDIAAGVALAASDGTPDPDDTDGNGDGSGEDDPIDGTDAAPIELSGLSAPYTSLTLGVGEKVDLAISPEPSNAECTLTYKSSRKKVAAVSANGTLVAKKTGKATITVRADASHALTLKVTVKKAPKKVTLAVGQTTMGVGQTTSLTVKLPKNTAAFTRTFSVDDNGVLSLTDDGRLSAVSPGEAYVKVTTYKRSAKVKVKVLPAPTYLIPSSDALPLAVGVSQDFRATLPPDTMASIGYESSDESIAVVDPKTGRVTGVSEGDTTVYGITPDGAMGVCTVHVLPSPSSIAFDAPEIKLFVGETWQPAPMIEPSDAYSVVGLTSSSSKIARVKNGCINALKPGKAVITATTCSGLSDRITVIVPKAPTSISLGTSYAEIATGESALLTYKLNKGESKVRFESSSPDIASVDPETGEIIGCRTGSAVITARTLNGKHASCLVTVDAHIDPMTTVDGNLDVTFMNIGRNDGILIRCGGEYAFIDSGTHGYGAKAVKYMRKQGVTHLKFYIGTHAHKDHVGGAGCILAKIPTDMVLVPHSRVIKKIRSWAHGKNEKSAAKRTPYHILRVGERFCIGGAFFEMLGPRKIRRSSSHDTSENYNSLILKGFYGKNTYLLTGDAMSPEFSAIKKKMGAAALKADVFKNPHHNGEQKYAAKLCNPKITVISTDKRHMPQGGYVSWLKRRGSKVYITSSNRHSHVTVSSDGEQLTVRTAKTPK
ncbi:MAG: Ig-like domain-containing protein [Clostridia bacterium]|nr:Ig-like domain-containing protein [Clostridia bacterium]